MLKKTERTQVVGYAEVKLVSDRYAGEFLDTYVYVGEKHLVTVSGNERLEFLKKLEELVEEYRI